MRWILALGTASVAACGDDTTSGSGSDTETGGTTLTTTESTTFDTDGTSMGTMDVTSSTTDTTATSTTTGTTTDSGTDTATGTTGGPNTDPDAFDDLYVTNTMVGTLTVGAASGVLANDEDVDGDTLSVDTFDAASVAGGTVAVAADGSFDYTPPAGYYGDDRFNYSAGDGNGGTSPAEVRIMVAPTTEDAAAIDVLISGEAMGDESGHGVGGGFDINGDQLEDVVVGALVADGPATGEGKAYAVFGGSGAIDLSQVAAGTDGFEMIGQSTGGDNGHAVALLGDVNGDGLGDVAIGAPSEGTGGEVYVVFGKADGTDVSLSAVAGGAGGFVVGGATAADELGYSVGAAGDVDGDGLADVVIGARQNDPATGFAVVVFGKTSTAAVAVGDLGASSGLGFTLSGETSADEAGYSAFGAGDTNGDGLDDLIVGAHFSDPGATSQGGRAYVVFGADSDANVSLGAVAGGTRGYRIDGTADLDQAGESVSAAGDVNGDGLADVIVGANGVDANGMDNVGRAYVVFGKNNTDAVALADVAAGTGGFAMTGETQFNLAGSSSAGLGDVNGDGFGDFIIGAYTWSAGRGRAYVVYGRTQTTEVLLADVALGQGGYVVAGAVGNNFVGWAVAGAGDVNGDGFDDAIIGAIGADPSGMNNAGRTSIIYGGDYLGLTAGDATSADDVLLGDTAANSIVGGGGDDEILGEGGNDVLYGGPGADIIDIPDGSAFFRLDGGTGDDTLRLSGNGVTMNLTNVPDLALSGFETVDITGAGNNTLVLDLRDLRALSPTSNTLTVVGDVGDTLTADLQSASFVDQGSAGGFTTYSNGVLTLVVDDDISSTVQI